MKGGVAVLLIENVKKSFGGTAVLSDLSLSVQSGQAVCIAGKNASGKTTLLKIIYGLIKADSGIVKADGQISFVPQQPALMDELSVQDNLKLWYAAQNLSGPKWQPDSIETKLGLLPYKKKKAKTLSGGMQKRLSIAAALVSVPDALLLDEPFAALDAAACHQLEELLINLKNSGTTVLFTSHEPEYIHRLADSLYILNDGKLSFAANPKELTREQLSKCILDNLYQTI